jgi:CubicO group peptidase (beta-lactamase class C family)
MIISQLKHLKPSTEIRQVMQYNNYHYWVLAQMIPRLTSLSYIDFVQTHFLDPLDMASSTYNHTAAESTGRRAKSYVREGKDGKQCREAWSKHDQLSRSCYGHPFATTWFTKGDGTFIAGPGGLVSSANDMVRCEHVTIVTIKAKRQDEMATRAARAKDYSKERGEAHP